MQTSHTKKNKLAKIELFFVCFFFEIIYCSPSIFSRLIANKFNHFEPEFVLLTLLLYMQKRMCVHIAVFSQLYADSERMKAINLYLNPFLAPTHKQIISFFFHFRKMNLRAVECRLQCTAFLFSYGNNSLRSTLLELLSSSSITKSLVELLRLFPRDSVYRVVVAVFTAHCLLPSIWLGLKSPIVERTKIVIAWWWWWWNDISVNFQCFSIKQ